MGRWAAPSTPPTHFVILAQFWPFLGSLYWALQLKIWNATLPLPVWENLFLLYHVIWGASLNYIYVGSGSRKDLRKPGTYCFPLFSLNGSLCSLGQTQLAVSPKKTFSFFDPCQPCSTNKETDENQKTKTCLVFNSLLFVDCLKPACVTVVSTTVLLCSSEICASSPFLACITTSWCLPR